MSNSSLIRHALALAAQQRGLGTPEARFAAEQLERVAQLLHFTAAETPDQYFDRLFANEESEREAAFDRGYHEGRMSVITMSSPCHN